MKSKIQKNMEMLRQKGDMTRREDITTPKRSGAIFKYTDSDLNRIIAQRSQLEEKLQEMENRFRDLVFSEDCVILEIKIRRTNEEGKP